jgi:hypothetical protein
MEYLVVTVTVTERTPDSDDCAAYAGVAAHGLAGTFLCDDAQTGGCVTVTKRVFLQAGGEELGGASGCCSSSALSAEVLLPFPLFHGMQWAESKLH